MGKFIVMPPGHGKSYNHGRWPELKEADKVIDCKGTDELQRLRAHAKSTGDWSRYNACWGLAIRQRVGPGDIVMVPAYEIGAAAFGEVGYLGTLCLERSEWDRNIGVRAGGSSKHITCYNAARDRADCTLVSTNAELVAKLLEFRTA